jgi:DNA-binding HxlR family transcriptional regulator
VHPNKSETATQTAKFTIVPSARNFRQANEIMQRSESDSSRDKKDTTPREGEPVLTFVRLEGGGMGLTGRSTQTLKRFDCPVHGIQRIINGKYKLRILWDLKEGPRRYGEIRKKLLVGSPGTRAVTPRVLSGELKNLVYLGLLKRTDRGEIPKRVEYKLTALGESLVPVISVMHKWGVKNLVRDSVLPKLGLVPEQGQKP